MGILDLVVPHAQPGCDFANREIALEHGCSFQGFELLPTHYVSITARFFFAVGEKSFNSSPAAERAVRGTGQALSFCGSDRTTTSLL
jgi:hypothetical protein